MVDEHGRPIKDHMARHIVKNEIRREMGESSVEVGDSPNFKKSLLELPDTDNAFEKYIRRQPPTQEIVDLAVCSLCIHPIMQLHCNLVAELRNIAASY